MQFAEGKGLPINIIGEVKDDLGIGNYYEPNMIDMNTPQPTTDDSNWNDIRWEEHDRVNPETAQGEQSTMMQLDFAKWAKANGTWATVSSYHENVKMWYEDVYNVIANDIVVDIATTVGYLQIQL